MTALHIAVRDQKVDMTRVLLANEEVDANCKDTENATPLHLAAESGNIEIGSMLLQRDDVDVNSETVFFLLTKNTTLHYTLSPELATKASLRCFSTTPVFVSTSETQLESRLSILLPGTTT